MCDKPEAVECVDRCDDVREIGLFSGCEIRSEGAVAADCPRGQQATNG